MHLPRLSLLTLLSVMSLLGAAASAGDDLDDGTHITIGPGLYSIPSYPGARTGRDLFIPFIDAEYDNRFYTTASDLFGVYAYKTDSTQAGAAVEYDLTERASREDARLRYFPDIKDTLRLKLFASRTLAFVTGDANVATDVEGRGQGTLAQGNLWLTLPLPAKSQLSAGPGVTWGSEQYVRTFFAVTPMQSLVSPLPVYATHAGIVDVHLNILATIELSSRWEIGISEYLGRLENEARASPITLRHGQTTALGWIAYKLR